MNKCEEEITEKWESLEEKAGVEAGPYSCSFVPK